MTWENMHVFRSHDLQDSVCQKLPRSVQAAVSYRRNLADIFEIRGVTNGCHTAFDAKDKPRA